MSQLNRQILFQEQNGNREKFFPSDIDAYVCKLEGEIANRNIITSEQNALQQTLIEILSIASDLKDVLMNSPTMFN